MRAYSTQRYFNGGFVCMTEACYNKTVSFKGVRINHLWTQLNGFVLGDKNAAKRADDLLDCATYAASIVWRPEPISCALGLARALPQFVKTEALRRGF